MNERWIHCPKKCNVKLEEQQKPNGNLNVWCFQKKSTETECKTTTYSTHARTRNNHNNNKKIPRFFISLSHTKTCLAKIILTIKYIEQTNESTDDMMSVWLWIHLLLFFSFMLLDTEWINCVCTIKKKKNDDRCRHASARCMWLINNFGWMNIWHIVIDIFSFKTHTLCAFSVFSLNCIGLLAILMTADSIICFYHQTFRYFWFASQITKYK